MAGAACMARTQPHMHAFVNKAWSAGKSCCCPRNYISMPPLFQEGQASPIFQRRLRRFPHLFLFSIETLVVGVLSHEGPE
eukprot:633659-Pelagomonas_calceolata.AAC.1